MSTSSTLSVEPKWIPALSVLINEHLDKAAGFWRVYISRTMAGYCILLPVLCGDHLRSHWGRDG
jgi:hypothetical protein